MTPPLRVQRCTTHHVCTCQAWRLEQMERALKVIRTWASVQDGAGLDPKHVQALCDKALATIREEEANDVR